jgi:L-alanine-DL-glutamate epimerase-like enolase superfamily enzyme
VNPFIQVRNGAIDLPATSGLGVNIDPDKIKKYEIASRSFSE